MQATLVSSVVKGVRDCPLDALRELLLEFLGHNGCTTFSLGMTLVGRVTCLGACIEIALSFRQTMKA